MYDYFRRLGRSYWPAIARTKPNWPFKMSERDSRPVFFFDIDNCLYSKSKRVQYMMGDLIDQYFMDHLSLSSDDANRLHARYYKDYGLAIEGLVRHHKVDAMDYNSKVDDALPLDGVIIPDPQLRQLLMDFDTQTVKLWLLTNAYVNHGRRVIKLLGVEDLFEGITFCDYAAKTFVCKPHLEMFEKARVEAGASSADNCYFVDDSASNCRAAQKLGWYSVHLVEPNEEPPPDPASKYLIRSLEELRRLFPRFFKGA